MHDLVSRLQEADRALAAQNWSLAKDLFENIYRTAEDDPNIHAGMAFACYKLGDIAGATRHFADAGLRRSEPQWIAFHIDCLYKSGAVLPAYMLLDFCESNHPEQYALLQRQGLTESIAARLSELARKDSLDWKPGIKPDRSTAALTATASIAKLLRQGKSSDAKIAGERLVRQCPYATGLLVNLGLACKRTGDFPSAMQSYLKAFLICPSDTGVCANLGNLLIEQGNIFQAIQFLEASAIARRTDSLIWSNLAAAYNHSGSMPVEAEFAASRALALPSGLDSKALANTHRSLAAALSRQGRVREAIVEYQKGTDNEDEASRTAPLMAMIMSDDIDADTVALAHRDYGKDLERRFGSVAKKPRRADSPSSIAFVTADFRDHSVSYFALPLVEHLHSLGMKLVAYYNFGREDTITEEYKQYFSKWVPVRGMTDEQMIQQIVDDQVDVLLDLSGHTSGHRLPVFMRRPAPLQITWLGHPATTGLEAIDARITDNFADPIGADHRYTERLIRLPGVFCAYRPLLRKRNLQSDPAYRVALPPVERNGFITFGSCNTLSKYSDTTIRLWSKVLNAVPKSRLLIESPGLHTVALQRLMVQRFALYGVNPQRLDLRERDRAKQYVIYNEIDISLDSFPCNGGTTTFDLLWMGVPLVTRAGQAFAERMGLSILSGLGRRNWVAEDDDSFVKIAIDLASDVGNLSRLRREQRNLMETSTLMDEAGFAEKFLAGVMQAWRTT
jgi:protein O-GlcNAc transferase